LGDVVVDGEDIFGEGVNVAARLETLSEPGGMCVSDAVHRSVENKVTVVFEFVGERSVKNITRPGPCLAMAADWCRRGGIGERPRLASRRSRHPFLHIR
jgi:adenylate cyclase